MSTTWPCGPELRDKEHRPSQLSVLSALTLAQRTGFSLGFFFQLFSHGVGACVHVFVLLWPHVLSPWDTGWLRGFVAFNGSLGQRCHTGYSTSDNRRPILLWRDLRLNQQLLRALLPRLHRAAWNSPHTPANAVFTMRTQSSLSRFLSQPLYFCLLSDSCCICFSFCRSHFLLLRFSRLPLFLFFFLSDCLSVVVSVSHIHVRTAFSIPLHLCQTLSAI